MNQTGGTGFTVTTGANPLCITAVSGGKATVDRAAGTLGSTGGTGILGGAKATLSDIATARTTLNLTSIKGAGRTYSGAGVTLADANGGGNTATPFNRIVGYHAVRGDITRESTQAGTTTRPVLTLASGAAVLTMSGIFWYLANLDIDCASIAGSTGIVGSGFCEYQNVRVRNYATAGLNILTNSAAIDCDATGGTLSTGIGINGGAQSMVSRCSAHDGAGSGVVVGATSAVTGCLIANLTGATADGIRYSGESTVKNNTIHNVGRHGIANASTIYAGAIVKDNLLSTPGASGSGDGLLVVSSGSAPSLPAFDGNAYFGMSSAAAIVGGGAAAGSIGYTPKYDILPTVLTVNPFVSSSTGDFRLNNLAGGGALLRGLAQPQPGFAAAGSGYFGCYAPADAGPGDQFTTADILGIRALLGLDGATAAPSGANVPTLRLGSAGLDLIDDSEPPAGARPAGFRLELKWLILRFLNECDKSSTGVGVGNILVKTSAGATITTQPYTDDGAGSQVVSKA